MTVATQFQEGPLPAAPLLKQGGRMRLVDQVLRYDATHVETETRVQGTWPFLKDGKARALVCFELMTQSVAAYLTLMHTGSGTPLTGVPVVTRIHEVSAFVPDVRLGDVLRTDAVLDAGDHYMGIFRARVTRDGAAVAEGRFTVGQFDRVRG